MLLRMGRREDLEILLRMGREDLQMLLRMGEKPLKKQEGERTLKMSIFRTRLGIH